MGRSSWGLLDCVVCSLLFVEMWCSLSWVGRPECGCDQFVQWTQDRVVAGALLAVQTGVLGALSVAVHQARLHASNVVVVGASRTRAFSVLSAAMHHVHVHGRVLVGADQAHVRLVRLSVDVDTPKHMRCCLLRRTTWSQPTAAACALALVFAPLFALRAPDIGREMARSARALPSGFGRRTAASHGGRVRSARIVPPPPSALAKTPAIGELRLVLASWPRPTHTRFRTRT